MCRFLGLPYALSTSWTANVPWARFKKGIFWRKPVRHYISFDRSGMDICHLRCLDRIIGNRLEGMEGLHVFEDLLRFKGMALQQRLESVYSATHSDGLKRLKTIM